MADPEVPDDEEELSLPPPDALTVARRALILSAVVCRSHLETAKDKEYRQQTAEYIHEWFDELDLWPHVEANEETIIRAEFGHLSRQLRSEGTWYVEGLAILAWALGRMEFPPHEDKVDPIVVTDALDFLSPDSGEFLASAALRPRKQLDAAREWFYDIHCTLRGFLHRNNGGSLPDWMPEQLSILGFDPNSSQSVVMIGNDLAFRSKPYTEAGLKALQEWESIINERHRAVIYLEGTDEPYTEISVDTERGEQRPPITFAQRRIARTQTAQTKLPATRPPERD